MKRQESRNLRNSPPCYLHFFLANLGGSLLSGLTLRYLTAPMHYLGSLNLEGCEGEDIHTVCSPYNMWPSLIQPEACVSQTLINWTALS